MKVALLVLLLIVTIGLSLSFMNRIRLLHPEVLLHMKNARSMRTTKPPIKKVVDQKKPINVITKIDLPKSVNSNPANATSVVTTFEDLMSQYRSTSKSMKIVSAVDHRSRNRNLTIDQAFLAMKTLNKMKETEKIPTILDMWLKMNTNCNTFDELNTTSTMIRFFSIRKDIGSVEKLTNKLGFIISSDPNKKIELPLNESIREPFNRILTDLCLGYISASDVVKATSCLKLMQQYNMTIDTEYSRKILKEYTIHTNTEHIRRCLRYLVTLSDGLDDNDALQIINNAFIRSIEFVKGAVSIDTLPPESCPEVCFIGRSNVGKSSLINSICNRKKMAYTSKKPGKTAEFNYFDAQGVVGPKKELHRFYLVDLPGVGYALKSRALRDNWTNLLRAYIQHRSTLRVVFHLVDSRHGLLESDEECLSLLENLPSNVQYVIVLTKVDKKKGAEKMTEIDEIIIDKIYSEIALRTTRVVPILFTSSAQKIGIASLWSTLLDGIHRIIPKDTERQVVDTDI